MTIYVSVYRMSHYPNVLITMDLHSVSIVKSMVNGKLKPILVTLKKNKIKNL